MLTGNVDRNWTEADVDGLLKMEISSPNNLGNRSSPEIGTRDAPLTPLEGQTKGESVPKRLRGQGGKLEGG
jgi:hypothetical protein